MHDNGAAALKDGLQEGTAWVLRPFVSYFLPLVLAAREGADFDVMSALRRDCPLLAKERTVGQDIAALLAKLKTDLDTLVEMFSDGSTRSIKDVLDFACEQDLAELDPRFMPYMTNAAADDPDEDDSEYQSVLAFLATPATQLWGYNRYIQSLSPFATQQGIKGAELRRVLVVLDDEESDYNLFSYAKYWGTEPLSAGDRKNIAEGKDSVLDRTRRLFYVCCSRAVQDLAVVFFVPNVQSARQAVLAKALFAPEDVHILEVPVP